MRQAQKMQEKIQSAQEELKTKEAGANPAAVSPVNKKVATKTVVDESAKELQDSITRHANEDDEAAELERQLAAEESKNSKTEDKENDFPKEETAAGIIFDQDEDIVIGGSNSSKTVVKEAVKAPEKTESSHKTKYTKTPPIQSTS